MKVTTIFQWQSHTSMYSYVNEMEKKQKQSLDKKNEKERLVDTYTIQERKIYLYIFTVNKAKFYNY